MVSKEMLLKQIKKLEMAVNACEVGTEEHDKLLKQLQSLLADLKAVEDSEKEEKSARFNAVIKTVEVAAGIVLPIVGLVGITAKEEGISFTGALKGYAQMFVPKKRF